MLRVTLCHQQLSLLFYFRLQSIHHQVQGLYLRIYMKGRCDYQTFVVVLFSREIWRIYVLLLAVSLSLILWCLQIMPCNAYVVKLQRYNHLNIINKLFCRLLNIITSYNLEMMWVSHTRSWLINVWNNVLLQPIDFYTITIKFNLNFQVDSWWRAVARVTWNRTL